MGIYIGQNKIGMVGSSSTSQVENGTLGKPTIDEFGVITTKVEKSGYLNAGASTSLELNTQGETTITPSNKGQTAVRAKVYTTGAVTVEAVPTTTQATPTISINEENGEITATSTQSAGWVSEGTTTQTYPLDTQAGKTITPTNEVQDAVPAKVYTTGVVEVEAVPSETLEISKNGTYTPSKGKWFSSVTVAVPVEEFNLQEKTVTPSEDEQVISPETGYNGFSQVTIEAIPSTYIGTGITRKKAETYYPSTNDKTISSGQYLAEDQTIKAIKLREEVVVTPTSDQIVVEPTSEYNGLSKVTVNAIQTETLDVSQNGTFYPSSEGKFISEVNVQVLTSGSGSTGLPDVIEAGDTPIMLNTSIFQATSTSLTDTGISLTIPKAGTYRFKWAMTDGDEDEDALKSRLYKNGTAEGTQKTTTSSLACSEDLTCAAGDIITLYFAGYRYFSNYYGSCGFLTACINWNIDL